jgi:hypothetical protein
MVKREILTHFLFFLAFFIFLSIQRNLFQWYSLFFWLGGLIGTIAVDLDHFLYAFFLNPQDLSSQRAIYYFKKREYIKGILVLWDNKETRTHQVFHSFSFQIIFLILTIWIVSSSVNIFAIGLVLAFSLHLFVDQLSDLLVYGNLNLWSNGFFNFNLEDRFHLFYWMLSFALFLIFSFVI